ncbi:MAG: YraN family protein [Rhodospirillaceae bacterium]|jgi:putative endonuclease|nr:YraN family protein [Rhodospirillales bacterium]MBT3904722.1 YraN family protein [Rhodospirillaceae bacterium]MBT4701608.1 YraN family protein [Rhodospirillaceae bacterium]MBT5036256.1 YraN family protein [Rhodospirillaceae bacterium]MBT6221610.1 YraN family protein [Rhodospirillaceae bacterium]
MRPAKTKRQAWQRGRFAETICAWVLRLKGYRILARGFRVPVGEIDIIARRGRLLVFVEVKARRSQTEAAESLSFRQRERITRAAQAYIAKFPGLSDMDMRFDAMLIVPGSWPRHLTDAWREGQ